jgi:hypothetical protein
MLVYTMSLIVLRRPSFFASISEIIAGAISYVCLRAWRVRFKYVLHRIRTSKRVPWLDVHFAGKLHALRRFVSLAI